MTQMRAGSRSDVGFYVSPRASTPPRGLQLPIQAGKAMDRVRGREGDLIVMQLRSEIGERPGRRDALRSLGLKGPGTAVLRLSSDQALWGNVRKVRDLVAVLALPQVQYRSSWVAPDTHEGGPVESFQYGTRNLPAELWRNTRGDYFAYETGRKNLVAFWSSSRSLGDLESSLNKVGLLIEPSNEEGFLGTADSEPELKDPVVVHHVGFWKALRESVSLDRAVAARIPLKDGLVATWRAPFQRFHDQDHVRGAVGMIVPRTEVLAIRSLARETGNEKLFGSNRCSVQIAIAGRRKEFRV